MSAPASTHAGDLPTTADDYEALLDTLEVLEAEALRKVESGRVYDAENEKVRIKWIRICKDVIDVKRKVMADRDLAELTERVEALEAAEAVP